MLTSNCKIIACTFGTASIVNQPATYTSVYDGLHHFCRQCIKEIWITANTLPIDAG